MAQINTVKSDELKEHLGLPRYLYLSFYCRPMHDDYRFDTTTLNMDILSFDKDWILLYRNHELRGDEHEWIDDWFSI